VPEIEVKLRPPSSRGEQSFLQLTVTSFSGVNITRPNKISNEAINFLEKGPWP